MKRFNGNKSLEWVRKFAYLLFNCAILDEYIMKKTCPHIKGRVSFVNLLAGNDVEKVLKRVSTELENMISLYIKYGNLNQALLINNAKSWLMESTDYMFNGGSPTNNPRENNHRNANGGGKSQIKYNFQYILYGLYPFHLILFWIYFIFNNNPNNFYDNVDLINVIIVGCAQFVFCIISSLVPFVLIFHIVFIVAIVVIL